MQNQQELIGFDQKVLDELKETLQKLDLKTDFITAHGQTFGMEPQQATHDLSYKNILKNEEQQISEYENGMSMCNLIEECKKANLKAQFGLLQHITDDKEHLKRLLVCDKSQLEHNRYSDIIPYEHNMVRLWLNLNQPQSNQQQNQSSQYSYINANYVSTSSKRKNFFIACQGPLEKSTPNFLQMILQEDVKMILQLCKVCEGGKQKSFPYFTQDNEPQIKRFTNATLDALHQIVEVEQIKQYYPFPNQPDWVVERILNIRLIDTNTKQVLLKRENVSHVMYECWPDHGVPSEKLDCVIFYLLQRMSTHYIQAVNTKDESLRNKVVIHCSAGIGRTGTLMAIFDLFLMCLKFSQQQRQKQAHLQKVGQDEDHRMSVFAVVRRLREQRFGAVQMQNQYDFIFRFIGDLAQKLGYSSQQQQCTKNQ